MQPTQPPCARPRPRPAAGGRRGSPAIVVLDTNVVLDWLLFADPGLARWAVSIESGHLRWVRTAEMADELDRVLARPWPTRWHAHRYVVAAEAQRRARLVATPRAASPAPRCADPDDQMFVDLAVALPARWLLTRDRALLRLAPAVRRFDLEIVSPSQTAP